VRSRHPRVSHRLRALTGRTLAPRAPPAPSYIIKDGGLQFCAASKHRQTHRLLVTLELYLREVRQLLEKEAEEAKPAAPAAKMSHAHVAAPRDSDSRPVLAVASPVGAAAAAAAGAGAEGAGGAGTAASGAAATAAAAARLADEESYDFWGLESDEKRFENFTPRAASEGGAR
jgi:hypothetical protein